MPPSFAVNFRTLPTHLACLYSVSKWRRFRKDGDELNKGVHDGAVAFAHSDAPLQRRDGLYGSGAP